jgi:hypothetical protein
VGDLAMLRDLARDLREAEWSVTAVLDMGDPESSTPAPDLGSSTCCQATRRAAATVSPSTSARPPMSSTSSTCAGARSSIAPLPTSGQIQAGEDVISRIVFSQKRDGLNRLQKMVLKTLNGLLEELTSRNKILPARSARPWSQATRP